MAVRWHTGGTFADRITGIGATHHPMSGYDFSVTDPDTFYPERLPTDHRELLRPSVDALSDDDGLVVAVTGGPDPADLGVPIVAAGKTEDKAHVAARVAYTGVGLDLKTQKRTPRRLRAEIEAAGQERATHR